MFSRFINVVTDIAISFFCKIWIVFNCVFAVQFPHGFICWLNTQVNSVSWLLWRVMQKTLEDKYPVDVLISSPFRYLLHSDMPNHMVELFLIFETSTHFFFYNGCITFPSTTFLIWPSLPIFSYWGHNLNEYMLTKMGYFIQSECSGRQQDSIYKNGVKPLWGWRVKSLFSIKDIFLWGLEKWLSS